jgi:hypothetical protein
MHALGVFGTRDSRNQAALDGTVTGIGKTKFNYTLWAFEILTNGSEEYCRALHYSQHRTKRDWNLPNLKAMKLTNSL